MTTPEYGFGAFPTQVLDGPMPDVCPWCGATPVASNRAVRRFGCRTTIGWVDKVMRRSVNCEQIEVTS